MPNNWSTIVAEHGRMVFRTAFRIVGCAADAEDVVQEVLLEAFSRAATDKIENWGAYLRKLTVFRAIDLRRKRRGNVSLRQDGFPSVQFSPVDEAVRHELAERLRDLIAALPQREGAVFALRYFEGLGNSDIAEVLEISTGAVAAAHHKVRAKLEAIVLQSRAEETS